MLDNISQISIYIKDDLEERVNEVALFKPFAEKRGLSVKILKKRWKFTVHLPLSKRLLLNIRGFFIRRFASPQRKTLEATFHTAIALLLEQETLLNFFLGTEKKKELFYTALKKTAQEIGYKSFTLPKAVTPAEMSYALTPSPVTKESLLKNPTEFALQKATLSLEEKNRMLFTLLSYLERPPLTSILEVSTGAEKAQTIALKTRYAKYQVNSVDEKTGQIFFTYEQDHATASIMTKANILPGKTGAVNQRIAWDMTDISSPIFIGSYSGALLTTHNVLEQLLMLLKTESSSSYYLLEEAPHHPIEKKTVLFTSLYSWNEFEKIRLQHNAIENLADKILKIVSPSGEEHYLRLNLLFQNLTLSGHPMPAETKGHIEDFNDSALIYLSSWTFSSLGIQDVVGLNNIVLNIEENRVEGDFILKERVLLEQIDRFRAIKKYIIATLDKRPEKSALYLKILLSQHLPNGKRLLGIDRLIYTDLLTKELEIIHNKNSALSIERTAAAVASDKAQHGFTKITGSPFLPGLASSEELSFFKALYTLYLAWEEPPITSSFSTGSSEEAFLKNITHAAPETSRYLLKKGGFST